MENSTPFNLKVHPAADLFPLIEGSEFDELVADIAAHGVREPIWLHEGKILDGRNRYRAAQAAGLDCPTREYVGTDPVGFVVSLNLKRRHLNTSQRDMVAAKLANMHRGGDRRSNDFQTAILQSVTVKEAAAALNVSERGVAQAKTVIASGSAALIKAVESGKISVTAGSRIAKLDKQQQDVVVARNLKAGTSGDDKAARGTGGTGEFERYTPTEYIEAARRALGDIDLDPATSKKAQKTVRATNFFTVKDDGLAQEWSGRVWLNPPYHRTLCPAFIDKLISEIDAGRVKAAIVLTNNCADTEWFQAAHSKCNAICFADGRIKFTTPDDETIFPTQGQAFFQAAKIYRDETRQQILELIVRVVDLLTP